MSFLSDPEPNDRATAMYDEDLAEDGFVWNATRLWAYQPETHDALFDLMSTAFHSSGLDKRQRGILVLAMASTLGDSYCSLAWGGKMSGWTDSATAAGVLNGSDDALTEAKQAMADWARAVVRDPNATTAADVQRLRDVGLGDAQIFAITTFLALRLAFSTVNDSLGAAPDQQLIERLPEDVVAAVSYGRPPA